MRYLPIMGELLSSDSFAFMLIGLAAAAVIAKVLKSTRKNIAGLGICFSVYVISEIISNMRISYLSEFILLFTGTSALGGIIGFLLGLIVAVIKNKLSEHR